MAEALIRGILNAQLTTPQNLRIGEPLKSRREHLSQKYGLQSTSINLDATSETDLVVIAIKPQNLHEVLGELKGNLPDKSTVISIVAGAGMTTLTKGLNHTSVVRIMPNTPSQIGAGVSIWTASKEVQKTTLKTIRDMLCTLGEEVYVKDEKLIDMATALSASGPAYVFLFIEALIDAGVYLGMPRELARQLTLQTVHGSTEMVRESGRHPAELKDMVTSPGGTTIEGLLSLENDGFRASVLKSVIAAHIKSKSLGG